jgi:hypothetical protein
MDPSGVDLPESLRGANGEVAWLLGHPDALAHWDACELRADLLAAQLP